jgi:hypothetical protein
MTALLALRIDHVILRQKGSGSREYIKQRLVRHRVSINTAMEIGSNEANKRAVIVGRGVSIARIGVIAKRECDFSPNTRHPDSAFGAE